MQWRTLMSDLTKPPKRTAAEDAYLQQFNGNAAKLAALAIRQDTLPKVLRQIVYAGLFFAAFAKYKGWW